MSHAHILHYMLKANINNNTEFSLDSKLLVCQIVIIWYFEELMENICHQENLEQAYSMSCRLKCEVSPASIWNNLTYLSFQQQNNLLI